MTSIQIEMNEKEENLMNIAIKAQQSAYSPYSKFKVGAAILSKDGKIFYGCNIENSSFGLTICAERVALFKAVSEGFRDFEAIAISSSSGDVVYPCGACRQVLAEFNKEMKVLVNHGNKVFTVSELLPHLFESDQIKPEENY